MKERATRLLFYYISYILRSGWVLIWTAVIIVSIFVSPRVERLLRDIAGADGTNLAVGIIGSVFGGVLVLLLGFRWLAHPETWLRRKLLPVNTHVTDADIEAFKCYDKILRSRIRGLLPEELRRVWDEGYSLEPYMIPVHAETVSTETKDSTHRQIANLLLALEREFFLNLRNEILPVTLQGEPGSGKSTLLFELYRQHSSRLLTHKQGWIPFIVFAHELSWDMVQAKENLKDLLVDYFKRSAHAALESKKVSPRAVSSNEVYDTCNRIANLVEESYDRYQFLVIIDGLDEIPERPLYEMISKKLNDLLEREWKKTQPGRQVNRYVISCRADDNQRIITSRLISLLPVDYESVLTYLKRLKGYYKKYRNTDYEKRASKIMEELRKSKTHKLLQNYQSNPLLLSLILKYYEDVDKPPASRLNQVFEHVLERELRKAKEPFEPENSKEERAMLRGYLSSLLAPFCYRRFMDGLTKGGKAEESFEVYLKEDENLSSILLGKLDQEGYLQGVFNKGHL